MLAGAFSSALGNLVVAVLVLASLAIYLTVIRQISARRSTTGPTADNPPARTFGLVEAALAGLLILFLLTNVVMAAGRTAAQLSSQDLIESFMLTLFVVFLVAAILKVRGIDIETIAGFSKISVKRAVSTAIVLLLAATPLILLAEGLTQAFLGGEASKQEIVNLFTNSGTIGQRMTVIVLAVVAAPMCEEFIFRFFIYGVLRRYFGIAGGLIFNALLFAAAHTHLPSAAPLFVLGACLTLAYEWSGSILVSMAMHALFNGTQLILLAFPELGQQ
jgi:uncharacterized protein